MQTDNEMLIDYLDKQLNQEETDQIERALQKDTDLNRELQYLKLAIDTVRLNAIKHKVVSIRQSHVKESTVEPAAPAVLRTMYKTGLRVAAVIVFFLCVATVYKYTSVSNQSFYDKQFSGYELGNNRGGESQEAEDDAYRNKQWNEVISIYNAGTERTNRQSFLAAMAEMQLNHFQNAISLFENILNAKTGDTNYLEESDYYLSLAYLMNHQADKAIPIINKIKANPNHTYYPLVSKFSSIDLKIIELKN
jgi:tetratricopeptide (TPR) repeat protein